MAGDEGESVAEVARVVVDDRPHHGGVTPHDRGRGERDVVVRYADQHQRPAGAEGAQRLLRAADGTGRLEDQLVGGPRGRPRAEAPGDGEAALVRLDDRDVRADGAQHKQQQQALRPGSHDQAA